MTTKALISVLITGILIFATWMWSGLGAKIEPNCRINGFGSGQCEFMNDGWSPGKMCIDVSVHNGSTGRTSDTSKVCSGTVWPGSIVTRQTVVRIPRDLCRTSFEDGKSWMDVCGLMLDPAK